MGRCKACNKVMTDAEMVRKDVLSNDYAELCSSCMVESDEAYLDTIMSDDDYLNMDVKVES